MVGKDIWNGKCSGRREQLYSGDLGHQLSPVEEHRLFTIIFLSQNRISEYGTSEIDPYVRLNRPSEFRRRKVIRRRATERKDIHLPDTHRPDTRRPDTHLPDTPHSKAILHRPTPPRAILRPTLLNTLSSLRPRNNKIQLVA
ncbi:unnamed protein product [Sphenostylis stenocarpa]|uniref:Uncharacterized protein n=1 Tax=Sphenostylis stenocarpa TaxID=92480 RepID=A0AA86S0V5_9FABA|nr:unnamed protein product [Sphenostylis stenocarpa]